MKLRVLLGLAVVAPLLAACGGGGSDSGKPSVVASFYPLEYVAQRVAGNHVDITTLTQPGREPHDLELTVPQTAAVADADVTLYSKGFQPAVDDAVDQAGREHVVDAAAAAGLEGDDPHFWLDPLKLAKVADAFRAQISAADPTHAAAYDAGYAALNKDLTALDQEYTAGLADCAVDTAVVSHDAFGYLERYGVDFVAINGLSPDAEPSPAHLSQLHELIRTDHITTVFSETLASPAMADTLAKDLGIKTDVLDPIEGLSDATANEDYLSLMKENLAALRKAGDCA